MSILMQTRETTDALKFQQLEIQSKQIQTELRSEIESTKTVAQEEMIHAAEAKSKVLDEQSELKSLNVTLLSEMEQLQEHEIAQKTCIEKLKTDFTSAQQAASAELATHQQENENQLQRQRQALESSKQQLEQKLESLLESNKAKQEAMTAELKMANKQKGILIREFKKLKEKSLSVWSDNVRLFRIS